MYKITVVITSYNLEKFISNTLDELYNQTFKDFNIVIIDDCSKDNTVKIANSYKSKFKNRLDIIKLEKNQGLPSKTRNYFLKNVKHNSEYLIFLDGDDSIEKNYLEELYNCAKKNNSDIVICSYDRVDEKNNKVLCEEMVGYPEEIKYEGEDVLCFINGSIWNKIFKSSFIKNIYLPEIKIGEDLCFQHFLYQKKPKINFINKILIHYLVHNNSVMSNTKINDIYDLANQMIVLKKNAKDDYDKDINGLLAFIHIGLSMTIRAYNNPNINNREHLKWTKKYFKDNYDFKHNKFLKLKNLRKHGVKGYALYACKILYKLNMFIIFLKLYGFMTRVLKKDFKF